MTDNRYKKTDRTAGSMDFKLSVGYPDKQYYKAFYGEAEVMFTLTEEEIRIPFVKNRKKGDFKTLMDNLVQDMHTNRVRFTNVTDKKVGKLLERIITGNNKKHISEVLNGFEKEYEDWEGQQCRTLVGCWEV